MTEQRKQPADLGGLDAWLHVQAIEEDGRRAGESCCGLGLLGDVSDDPGRGVSPRTMLDGVVLQHRATVGEIHGETGHDADDGVDLLFPLLRVLLPCSTEKLANKVTGVFRRSTQASARCESSCSGLHLGLLSVAAQGATSPRTEPPPPASASGGGMRPCWLPGTNVR